MSTLKVDNIRHNSATSDAITMVSDGTCTAKLTDVGGTGLSHRNVLRNGAMTIHQRVDNTTGINDTQNYFVADGWYYNCLLYTSPSPRDRTRSRMPSSA